MKNNIEAIIFDLDGIITNTAEYHYKSWKIPLENEGINFSKTINEKLRGRTRRDSIKTILKENNMKVSTEKEDEIMLKKNNYYQEMIKDLDKDDMITGVYDILLNLKNKDYKLAVASASRNAKLVIKNLGLNHFFKTISDGNSVEKSKPAPDIFHFTAQKINVDPKNCLVLEDSRAGVIGAKKAGMLVIGIGPVERIGDADFCYENISDMEMNKILN